MGLAASGFLSTVIGIACAAVFVSRSRFSERLSGRIHGYDLLLTGAIVNLLLLVVTLAGGLMISHPAGSHVVFAALLIWVGTPLRFIANVLLLVGSTKVLLAALPHLATPRTINTGTTDQ